MKNASRYAYFGSAAVMLVFYIFIAFCVPYCHDDWDWGLAVGMEQWLTASLNSRYVGSFFAVIMTRSEIVKTFIIGLTLFVIPILLERLCGNTRSLKRYFLSNFLLLFIGKAMWQQTHGWVSAFANYVIAAALTLFLILMLERSSEKLSPAYWLLLPLSTAVCLFHENLSIYAVVTIIAFTLYSQIRRRRTNLFHIAMCVGVLVGCVIMFSSSMYKVLLCDGVALGGIRQIAVETDGGLFLTAIKVLKRFVLEIFPKLFTEFKVAAIFPTIMLTIEVLFGCRNFPRVAVSSVAALFCVLACLPFSEPYMHALTAICLFVCDFVLILFAGGDKLLKKLFFLISAPLLLLPMAVVTELGPRLYYLPYLFMMAVGISAVPEMPKRFSKALTCISALALACCMLFYGFVYTQIRTVTELRADAIEEVIKNGGSEVIMKKDPYKYWWGRNCGEERMGFFKQFYGIPDHVTVIFEE